MNNILCWLGFHDWKRIALLSQRRSQPTRCCVNCMKTQGLFRGAGAGWMDVE